MYTWKTSWSGAFISGLHTWKRAFIGDLKTWWGVFVAVAFIGDLKCRGHLKTFKGEMNTWKTTWSGAFKSGLNTWKRALKGDLMSIICGRSLYRWIEGPRSPEDGTCRLEEEPIQATWEGLLIHDLRGALEEEPLNRRRRLEEKTL